MKLRYDLTGKRFGKLVVLERTGRRGRRGRAVYWLCKCDCGGETIERSHLLRAGQRVACRECIPLKAGKPMGYKHEDEVYHKRIHDKPLTRKEIKQYRKNLKDPEYMEVATEGAAMKLTDVIFALIERDRRDEMKGIKRLKCVKRTGG